MKLIYRVIRCIALTGEIIAGKEESPCIYWTGRNTLWEVINLAFSDHYPIYGIMHGLATHPNKHRTIRMRSWNAKKKKLFHSWFGASSMAPDRFFHRCGWHVFNPWLTTFLIKEETHNKGDFCLIGLFNLEFHWLIHWNRSAGRRLPDLWPIDDCFSSFKLLHCSTRQVVFKRLAT